MTIQRPHPAIFNMTTPRTTPHFQRCKHCGQPVNLDDEGETYRDGSAAHEECADAETFRRENAADFQD